MMLRDQLLRDIAHLEQMMIFVRELQLSALLGQAACRDLHSLIHF